MTAIQLELPFDIPAQPVKPAPIEREQSDYEKGVLAGIRHQARAMDAIFTLMTGSHPFDPK